MLCDERGWRLCEQWYEFLGKQRCDMLLWLTSLLPDLDNEILNI